MARVRFCNVYPMNQGTPALVRRYSLYNVVINGALETVAFYDFAARGDFVWIISGPCEGYDGEILDVSSDRQSALIELSETEFTDSKYHLSSKPYGDGEVASVEYACVAALAPITLRDPHVEIIPATTAILELLKRHPEELSNLSPAQFEDFTCDRLDAAGFLLQRTGPTNRPDGGIDVIAVPKSLGLAPFVLAVQIKQKKRSKIGSPIVDQFAGAIAPRCFTAGLLVTNTTFSFNAEWAAKAKQKMLYLRGFSDLKRWIQGDFRSELEWREVPHEIELCPGFTVPIPRPKRIPRRSNRAMQ